MTVDIDVTPIQETIVNFSKTLSRTPIVKTTSNMSGNEILTAGTPANIAGALYRKESAWGQERIGLFEGADAILLILPDVTLNKNDVVSYNGESFRVEKVTLREIAEIDCYKVAQLWLK